MEDRYVPYIVVDGKEFEIKVSSLLTREEAEDHTRCFVETKNINHLMLVNGIIGISDIPLKNIYFVCKKVSFLKNLFSKK